MITHHILEGHGGTRAGKTARTGVEWHGEVARPRHEPADHDGIQILHLRSSVWSRIGEDRLQCWTTPFVPDLRGVGEQVTGLSGRWAALIDHDPRCGHRGHKFPRLSDRLWISFVFNGNTPAATGTRNSHEAIRQIGPVIKAQSESSSFSTVAIDVSSDICRIRSRTRHAFEHIVSIPLPRTETELSGINADTFIQIEFIQKLVGTKGGKAMRE